MNINELEVALKRAYALGQTYWQQADSDYTSQHRKADETQARFEAMRAEAVASFDAEIARHKDMLFTVINSVCSALERAGVEAVDDPGEAIDVLVADKDAEIARLREALEGVIRVADRKTVEFDAARAALAKTGESNE